jgi:DNA-binding NtrC family response regulator
MKFRTAGAVGSMTDSITCLPRAVVATNCDIGRVVLAGTFCKDLYYRLRTHQLQLPPLRRRAGDLLLLVNHFIEQAAGALGKPAPAVPHALYQLLRTYSFPGNVRELEAMVFDAVARCQSLILPLHSFKEAIGDASPVARAERAEEPPTSFAAAFPDRLPTLKEAEEALINEALARAGGNQGVAAGILGLSRQALNKRLARGKYADNHSDRSEE